MTATEPVAAQPKGHKKGNSKKGKKKAAAVVVDEPIAQVEISSDVPVETDQTGEAPAIQGIRIALFDSYHIPYNTIAF